MATVLAFALVGCVEARQWGDQAETSSLVAAGGPLPDLGFDYAPAAVEPDLRREAESDSHLVDRVRFRSVGDNGQDGNLLTALYYQGKAPGAKRLVIILPIWGSYTYPSQTMTETLLKRDGGSTSVLRILGERRLFDYAAMGAAESPADFARLLDLMTLRVRNTVVDLRRVIDWAETRAEIDAARIALVGFSIGGLVAGIALGNELRFAAGAVVMGAARPHEILAACDTTIEDMRRAVTGRFGWSLETYKKALRDHMWPIDPARFAGRYRARRLIMFDAAGDSCMPSSAREALWDAMGRPKRISLYADHQSAFLAMTPLNANYLQRAIYRFLDDALSGAR